MFAVVYITLSLNLQLHFICADYHDMSEPSLHSNAIRTKLSCASSNYQNVLTLYLTVALIEHVYQTVWIQDQVHYFAGPDQDPNCLQRLVTFC